jgi:hypothetical protein
MGRRLRPRGRAEYWHSLDKSGMREPLRSEFHVTQRWVASCHACVARPRPVSIVMNSPITRVARSFFSTNSILRGSAKMPKFFVYAPDAVDPDTLDKRYEVRARHFEKITPLIESGVVRKSVGC